MQQPETIDFDDSNISKLVDFIISRQPLAVSVTGGEPLLFFEQIKSSVEKLCQAGVFVTIYTNGTVITEEMARFFALHHIRIMISFPSASEQEFSEIVQNKYTYNSVISAMDLLLKHRVYFQPNIVVTALNKDSLEDTIAFLCEKYKVETVFVSRATRPSNADETYDAIKLNRTQLNEVYDRCVKLAKKYRIKMASCGGGAVCLYDHAESREMFSKICDFGEGGYVVAPNGDVRICSRDDTVYGNVFQDDFLEIRQHMEAWKNRAIPPECKTCSYAEKCRGGCRVARDTHDTEWTGLDCDADPNKQKTGKSVPLINPFRRFTVQNISVLKDVSAYRVSVLMKYVYVQEAVASLLSNRSTFSYLRFLAAHKGAVRTANDELVKLLRAGIIR